MSKKALSPKQAREIEDARHDIEESFCRHNFFTRPRKLTEQELNDEAKRDAEKDNAGCPSHMAM